MRKIGPAVFKQDTELTESIEVFGPATARGNLTVHSMKVLGPMNVAETLEIESSLSINGPLLTKGSFISLKEAKNQINGPLTVRKGIIGGVLSVNGPLKAEYVDVQELYVNGPLNVKGDVQAEDLIKIGVGHSSVNQYLEVGGVIEAPTIYLKNYGRKVPGLGAITKIIGFNITNKRVVTLENLRIRTKVLKLKGVKLWNCDIQADQIIDYDQDNEIL